MKDVESIVARLQGRGNAFAEAIRSRLQRVVGRADPLMIMPYLGYGTSSRLFVNGRVLEDEGITPSGDEDTTLQNLLQMYKRFETDEVRGGRVRIRFQDVVQEVMTDDEGYFSLEFRPSRPLEERLWHHVTLELLHPPSAASTPIRATGRILVPPRRAKFGVISDIDDTIIQSHIGNRLRMILTVALRNARTRLPFAGVAAFYTALQQGVDGNEHNPIFYVSKSPWNLFDLLVEFLEIHGIPIGPLFLRDVGVQGYPSSKEQENHKSEKIAHLLDCYAQLPFILIGDSGEQDPEVYAEIVKRYPNRIQVIYIRNVSPGGHRIAAIQALAEAVCNQDCQLVLVADSASAAAHAAGAGLLSSNTLVPIHSQTATDQNAPVPQETFA